MDFKEQLKQLRDGISAKITTDMSTEEVNAYGDLLKQVDELGNEHQKFVDAHNELKDRYIESVKGYGTTDKPADDNAQQGKTFEQILSEIEQSSKKG